MDPLSDILSLLKPASHLAGLIDLRGSSAVAFPSQSGALKCNTLLSGRCWVTVEGEGEPVLVEQGDFFLLASGRPFAIATDLSTPPEPIERYLAATASAPVSVVRHGADHARIASCRFTVAQDHPGCFGSLLSPLIVIAGADPVTAQLRYLVEGILDEVAAARPGGDLIAQHLSHILLVQTLRHPHVAKDKGLGWLKALADSRLASALTAMHKDPGRKWSLADLARCAGMSRSIFAKRFHETVGQSPIEYLSVLRMVKASEQLASTGCTVAAAAQDFGYQSESAFNTAFKRIMGRPPRQYASARTKTLADAAATAVRR